MKPNVLDSAVVAYFAAVLTLQARRSGGRSEGIRSPCLGPHGRGRGRRRRAQTRESAAVVARQSKRFNMCGSPARRGRAGRGIMAKV